MSLSQRIGAACGSPVVAIAPLGGGCIGQVYHVELTGGAKVVAKVGEGGAAQLDIEGYMLDYLRRHSGLPVPDVLYSAADLLLMEFVPGDNSFSPSAQHHAAELLAALHHVRGKQFGLERDTLIGGLPQPNTPTESWLDFFGAHRLRYMANEAFRAGRLPDELRRRVALLSEHLDNWLAEPAHPSLIHGDVWTTNVLARDGQISAFLDPAIYYADPEVELAFITLFTTFDKPFCARYQEIRLLEPGFFEVRRHLYNLYPLLVHARLFGGSYVHSVAETIRRFGF